MKQIVEKVMTDKTSTGTGEWLETYGHPYVTMIVKAEDVTSGATVKLEGSPDGDTTYEIASTDITANGVTTVKVTGEAHAKVRVNLSSYTDGKYNVWIVMAGSPSNY